VNKTKLFVVDDFFHSKERLEMNRGWDLLWILFLMVCYYLYYIFNYIRRVIIEGARLVVGFIWPGGISK